jgi:hypothetical protein
MTKFKRPPLRQNVQDTWAIEQARRDADNAHRWLEQAAHAAGDRDARLSEADANRLLLETVDLPAGDDYYLWMEKRT